MSTVNRWPGKAIIVGETCSERPITATDDKYCKLVDDFIQNDQRITQKTPIILQHGNACPHTSCATEEALRNLKFKLIPHPPYSPKLA
ncbi:hypothetical protein J437_LFUL010985 [Ladona fulva]|uniref:Transposase n=1 Tax=Ladona fulva TaxID=123851 RepID=A0A8K0KKE5_LADFU|nr:hypothetical protein J437_LFUL010985 [Ladona fulva]